MQNETDFPNRKEIKNLNAILQNVNYPETDNVSKGRAVITSQNTEGRKAHFCSEAKCFFEKVL